MTHWKVLTHDWRPPIQGGDPLCDGTTWPVTLPEVGVDATDAGCGAGWNCVTDLAAGLRIAGLWPTGRPSRVVVAEPTGPSELGWAMEGAG